MRIRIAVPDAHVSPEVLNAALETTTRANEAILASGAAEPISEAIRNGAVRWKPEPFKDGEHFDMLDTVHRRGWGDCDDLAPALAAELRHKGADHGARAVVRRSGPKRWHAVTELSSGEQLDPSEWAGMYEYKKKHGDTFVNGPGSYGLHGTSIVGVCGDLVSAMLGVKPYGGGYSARCDLPMVDGDMAVVGVSMHPDPVEAIGRAVNTACIVGATSGAVTPEDIARAICVRACFEGHVPEEVHALVQHHMSGAEVGSLFGSIFHGLGKIASPVVSLAKKAAPFIPIPGVSLAAQAADSLLHHGGGAAHPGGQGGVPVAMQAPGLAAMTHAPPQVHTPQGSHGPIIVKF